MTISINERLGDLSTLLDEHFVGMQAMLWTAVPGIIDSYDASEMTCSVIPAILGKVAKEDGSIEAVQLPMLIHCPVIFPRGGGCSLTFPLKKGDECLVVFSARAIDFWWQSGGVQPPAETRMHDLSDGFVLPGPYSQKQKISSPSTSEVVLRSDDGSASVALNPSSHKITIVAPGDLDIVGDVNITGDVVVTKDVKASGISLNSHVHGGVSTGPNSTGGPQ